GLHGGQHRCQPAGRPDRRLPVRLLRPRILAGTGAAFALLLPARPRRVAPEQAERAVRMSPPCSSAQASLATAPRTNTRPASNSGTVHVGYTVAPELAADAIDELLGMAGDPQIMGSSPGVAQLRGPPRSIHLHATDTGPELAAEWLIELGPDGFTWRHGHDKATVALGGPVADAVRVFYGRLSAGSERVEVLGEAALLDFWLERVSLS